MTQQAIETKGPPHQHTDDLSFAAYAYMRGMRVIKATQQRRGQVEFQFTFEDPDGQWKALQVDFMNSEAVQYDNAVRQLKQWCRMNGAAR
jgi:hypothetical protein